MADSYDGMNINVLNVAKEEYTHQLNRILSPLILQGVESIYEDACQIEDKDKDEIYNFQILLKEIPKWNSHMIQDECERIKGTCDWLHDLITAVFVTNVKILTSVKLVNKAKQFKLKMPNFETFVHAVYIETARHLFNQPFLLYKDETTVKRNKNKREVLLIVQKSIEETIRMMMPVQHILQEYMQGEGDEEDEEFANSIERGTGQSAGDFVNTDITNQSNSHENRIKNMVNKDLQQNSDMFENEANEPHDSHEPNSREEGVEDTLESSLENEGHEGHEGHEEEQEDQEEDEEEYENEEKNVDVALRDRKAQQFGDQFQREKEKRLNSEASTENKDLEESDEDLDELSDED